jgi:hypothetical protein
MRQRIEDLGRLSVKLQSLFDDEVFHIYNGRRKDFIGWFNDQTEEKRHDILHELIYGLERLHEGISDCCCIADGNDDMNEESLS